MGTQDDIGDVLVRASQQPYETSEFDIYIAGLLGVSPTNPSGAQRIFGTFPNYFAYGNFDGVRRRIAQLATFWVIDMHLYEGDVVTIRSEYNIMELSMNADRYKQFVLYPSTEAVDLYSLHPTPWVKMYLNGDRYSVCPCGWVISNEMLEKL